MSVKVYVAPTPEDAGRAAAALITQLVEDRPSASLGVATGSSPLPIYRALAETMPPLAGARFFALDEYVGLLPHDPNSYRTYLLDNLVHPLGLDPDQLTIPDGSAPDPQLAAADFGLALSCSGGIDLQILGVGRNGHLGFNEPPADFGSRARVVALAESTRADNARFFARAEDVPTQAITQGLADIGAARRLLLIANGAEKGEPVARALRGRVTEEFPASMLQSHPDVAVVLDVAAASELPALTEGVWQSL